MKVALLNQAVKDMVWWRRYYKLVFPEGRSSAYLHMEQSVMLLAENPLLGREVEGLNLREHAIPRTPFALVYRVRSGTLEIVRVWDMRRRPDPSYRE